MKIKRFFLHIVIMMIGLMACGCKKDGQNVLVVLGSQSELTYDSLEAAVTQWAKENEVSLKIVAPTLPTVYGQEEELEKALSEQKWDLVVIEPLGNNELYPLLDYAKSQGSTVVSIQGSPGLYADYTIQPCDYEELGSSMMDVFAEAMGKTGSYVTIVPTKDSEIVLEEELACVTRQKNSYTQMLATSRLQEGSNIQAVAEVVDDLYEAYEMEGVLFFSYIQGLGVSQWKQSTGQDLIAVGVGDLEMMQTAMDAGNIDALFSWNRENLVLTSLDVGFKAVQGSIEKDADVITTGIDGYRTLRSLGNGVYYGNDISVEYRK